MSQDQGNGSSAVEDFPYRSSSRPRSFAAAGTSRAAGDESRVGELSLRVSREFVAAVPKAAAVLTADDVRNWAELAGAWRWAMSKQQ